jgi:hypothetical protein
MRGTVRLVQRASITQVARDALVASMPEWSLLGIAHLKHLPGIRWKLHNLELLNAKALAQTQHLGQEGDAQRVCF